MHKQAHTHLNKCTRDKQLNKINAHTYSHILTNVATHTRYLTMHICGSLTRLVCSVCIHMLAYKHVIMHMYVSNMQYICIYIAYEYAYVCI